MSYKVLSLNPFEVQESSEGTGAACGAMYLNDGFGRLIHSMMGTLAPEIITERRLEEAKRCFETTIKCVFNPLAPDCEDEYEIPLPGARDVLPIGLEGGYLALSKYAFHFVRV